MTNINPSQIEGTPIKELPLSSMIQPANDIILASGMRSILQRETFAKDRRNFFLEFGNSTPQGEIRPLFPDFDPEEILTDGWVNLCVGVELAQNEVTLKLEGHYEKPPVPTDITMQLTQSKSGYSADQLTIFDRRTEKESITSLKEIMETRMKSGDFKYASANDVYGEMNFQRIIKVLNRFLKDWALKNRIIERD